MRELKKRAPPAVNGNAELLYSIRGQRAQTRRRYDQALDTRYPAPPNGQSYKGADKNVSNGLADATPIVSVCSDNQPQISGYP
jgi:hypothetical protein